MKEIQNISDIDEDSLYDNKHYLYVNNDKYYTLIIDSGEGYGCYLYNPVKCSIPEDTPQADDELELIAICLEAGYKIYEFNNYIELLSYLYSELVRDYDLFRDDLDENEYPATLI